MASRRPAPATAPPTNAAFTAFADSIRSVIAQHREDVATEDWPIVKIVDDLLALAYAHGTSDIHIEPYETQTLVRFRIDGLLHDVAEVPKVLHELLSTRLKILARLRTDEHAAAQDGKLRFAVGEEKVDVRVSIVPVVHGEKTVLRLLADTVKHFSLETLGFSETDLEKIQRNIRRPWGMLLATGPTGSGKTTTLYAMLKILNRPEVNCSTIEDPVEYEMPRINQIQVNAKTNLTFAKGLRAIVRQDPNIIMVGEIRDEETAKIAINSALTGHLVLSTIHTNDAATTLPRLADMGIPPFLVASTVNIAVAQRLVRKVCDACAVTGPVDPALLAQARERLSAELIEQSGLRKRGVELRHGKGCGECRMSGYRGRSIIAEVLEIDDAIRGMIMERRNASEVTERAVALGMTPMVTHGLQKVLDGTTTLEELLRVVQE